MNTASSPSLQVPDEPSGYLAVRTELPTLDRDLARLPTLRTRSLPAP